MKSYLIVIPARGGSKGIPHKNIIDVGGKPLIAYSIQVAIDALERGLNGEMVVSTDDRQIAQIAKEYGGNVPFMRPDIISGDSARSVDFMLHALHFFNERGYSFDASLLLQPISPIRTADDLFQAINIYEASGQKSLISTYREEYICDLVSYHKHGDIAVPLNPLHNAGVRRQEHEKQYIRNGAIYITDVEYMKKERKIICDTPAMYVMPKNRSLNIDTLDDLELLRWRLR